MDYVEFPSSGGMPVKKVFSRIGWAMAAAFFCTQAMQVILSLLIQAFAAGFTSSPWFVWLVSSGSFYLIGMPAAFLILRTVPAEPLPQKPALRVPFLLLLAVVSIGTLYLFNYVSVGINMLLSMMKGRATVNPLDVTVSSSSLFLNFLFGCVLAPLMEELFFRFLVIRRLARFGTNFCIVASGLIFGLYHGNLSQFFYAFALGALFAGIYLYSGRIIYSILLHIMINMIGMLIVPWLILTLQSPFVTIAVEILMVLSIVAAIVFYILVIRQSVTGKRITPSFPSWQEGEVPPVPVPDPVKEIRPRLLRRFLASPGVLVYGILCIGIMVYIAII